MFHKNSSLFFAATTALTLSASAGLAQQWAPFEQISGWTINSHTNSEAAGSGRSCSAVSFSDHVNALRIERVAEGHLIGFNGWSREQAGPQQEVEFWFDGSNAGAWHNTAQFVKDAAYPHDDWLSLGHPIDAQPAFSEAFAGKNSITFRQNGSVTSTFQLADLPAVLSGLERCFNAGGAAPAFSGAQSAQGASSCPDDGPRLAGSGLCQGRAVNYLNLAGPEQDLQPGCEWVVNETALPGGDYLLYLAAKCGPHTSKLELSAGAQMADLNLSVSALSDGSPGWSVAKVFAAGGGRPEDEILMRAQQAMHDPADHRKCEARKLPPQDNLGGDAYVVGYKPQFQSALPADGPALECGDYGLGDSTSFWRVFGGFAWFFDMGQDAWWDFDPASLTVLTAAELRR